MLNTDKKELREADKILITLLDYHKHYFMYKTGTQQMQIMPTMIDIRPNAKIIKVKSKLYHRGNSGWVCRSTIEKQLNHPTKLNQYLTQEKYKISGFIQIDNVEYEYKAGRHAKDHQFIYRLNPARFRDIFVFCYENTLLKELINSAYFKQYFKLHWDKFEHIIKPNHDPQANSLAKLAEEYRGSFYYEQEVRLLSQCPGLFYNFCKDESKFTDEINRLYGQLQKTRTIMKSNFYELLVLSYMICNGWQDEDAFYASMKRVQAGFVMPEIPNIIQRIKNKEVDARK